MIASSVPEIPARVWDKAFNQKKIPLGFKTLLTFTLGYVSLFLICLGVGLYYELEKSLLLYGSGFGIFASVILAAGLYTIGHIEKTLRQAQDSLAGMLSIFPCLVTDRRKGVVFANALLRNKFPLVQREGFESLLGCMTQKNQKKRFLKDVETGLKGSAPFSSVGTFITSEDLPEDTFISVLPLSQDGLFLWRFLSMDDFRQRFFQKNFEDSGFLKSLDLVDLFNAAPAGDLLLDREGIIQDANQTFLSLFTQTPSKVCGRPFLDLVSEKDQESVEKLLQKCRNTQDTVEQDYQEFTFKKGGDAIAYVSSFEYPSLDLSGQKERGLFLQIFDNKERKEIQARVLKSQKTQALGQLAGGVAHDFNNLLTAMIGFCDLLLVRHTPNDQSFSDVMQIKQNANRAANLVRQLLAFSRQQTLQPRVMDITSVLEDVSLLLQRLVGSSIRLSIVHGRELGSVKVDRGQFEQVIINLVVNARDALQGEGEILIQTSLHHFENDHQTPHDLIQTGQYVHICISDTGEGIKPENIDKVFDPFFSTKEVGSGTGLGLATVQGIINQTGGYISVDSTPGKGTSFHIYLPVFQGEKAQPWEEGEPFSKDPPLKDLTGKGTILLVEDEDAVRLFSARALRDKGYTVVEASTGEEALAYLMTLWESGHKTVDLLVTDVVMPVMDGPTLVNKAHTFFPELKVVFISGYAQETFREKLKENTIIFLPKPYSLKALASIVKTTLNQRKSSSSPLRRVS